MLVNRQSWEPFFSEFFVITRGAARLLIPCPTGISLANQVIVAFLGDA